MFYAGVVHSEHRMSAKGQSRTLSAALSRSARCQELSLLAALSVAKEQEGAQGVGQLDRSPKHVFGDGQADEVDFRSNLLKPHPTLGHLVIGAQCRVRIVEQGEP